MSALADLLESRRDAVLGAFEERAHIHDLFSDIVHGLRRTERGGVFTLPLDLDLEKAIREYTTVQHAIFDLVIEAGIAPDVAEMKRLGEAVSGAIVRATAEMARRAGAREERLRRESAQSELEDMLREAPIGVAVHEGDDHRYTFANRLYLTLVDGRDVVGKPLFEALPEIRGQGFDALFDRVMRNGEIVVGNEVPVTLLRNGVPTQTWFTYVFMPKRDGTGANDGVIQYAYEVTAQVEARKNLTSLIESIADQSVFGVAVIEGPDLELTVANEGYRRMFGNRDLVGKRLLDALPELAVEGAEAMMKDIMRTGRGMTFDEHMYVIDMTGSGQPEKRYYSAIWQPILRPDGTASGILVLVHDVTASVLARGREEELRASAEEANRLKDEFIATVSHELRTPLNAMLGWVQMLRTGHVKPERTARALETIERNARAQSQLVEDLLDIARIASGKLALEVSTVKLGPVVEAAIESTRLAAESRNIQIRATLSDATLRGDASRLQQIAWNLLTNAVKFSSNGDTVDVSLVSKDGFTELVVQDHGKGIDSDFLPFVFDRFRQAEGSPARAHGGLGLGLSIVKHLVELHGGVITAESEGLGKGATFRVTLPTSTSAQRIDTPVVSPRTTTFECPAVLRGLRVLVVDDEQDALDLYTSVLQTCGVEVLTANNAAHALEQVRTSAPDLLVSDISMPGEDGYSLIGKVRELAPTEGGRTVAVALTAYARAEDRTKALRAGFNAHLSKPVEPVDLVAVLAALAPLTHAQN